MIAEDSPQEVFRLANQLASPAFLLTSAALVVGWCQ